MGLFSRFKKKKDKEVNTDAPKSTETKKEEPASKPTVAYEPQKTATKAEKKVTHVKEDSKTDATAKKDDIRSSFCSHSVRRYFGWR